jgi:hypothetical protein
MAVTQATTLADFTSGIGTAGAILQVDNADQRVGVSGLGTALSNDTTNVLSKVFFVNQTLDITSETTVTAPDSASQSDAGFNVAYTNFQDVNVSDSIDLIIADGSELVLDVLQLR